MDVKPRCTLGACEAANALTLQVARSLGRRMSWGPLFSDFGVSKAGSAVITRIGSWEGGPPSVRPSLWPAINSRSAAAPAPCLRGLVLQWRPDGQSLCI